MGRMTRAIALAIGMTGFMACGGGSGTDAGQPDAVDVVDVADPGKDVPTPMACPGSRPRSESGSAKRRAVSASRSIVPFPYSFQRRRLFRR